MGNFQSNEKQPQWERLNKFTNATVPVSGNIAAHPSASFHLSGASPQICGPLLDKTLYEIVSPQACHAEAYSAGLIGGGQHSASTTSGYWPADLPRYHIVRSGSSDYLSFASHDGSVIEVTINVVENLDVPGR